MQCTLQIHCSICSVPAPTQHASGSVCAVYLQPTLQIHWNYIAYTLHFGLGIITIFQFSYCLYTFSWQCFIQSLIDDYKPQRMIVSGSFCGIMFDKMFMTCNFFLGRNFFSLPTDPKNFQNVIWNDNIFLSCLGSVEKFKISSSVILTNSIQFSEWPGENVTNIYFYDTNKAVLSFSFVLY